MAWMLAAVYLLAVTPLRLSLRLRLGAGENVLDAGLLIWGVALRGSLRIRPDGQGTPRLEASFRGKALPAPAGAVSPAKGVLRVFRTLRRADAARRLLIRGTRVDSFRIAAVIGGRDAARTALFTGALRALGVPCAPRFGGKSALRAQLIMDARLGVALLAAALGVISYFLSEKKEDV